MENNQGDANFSNTNQSKVVLLAIQGIVLNFLFTLLSVIVIVFITKDNNPDPLKVLSAMALGAASGMTSCLGWGLGLAIAPNILWRVILGLILGVIWRFLLGFALFHILFEQNNLIQIGSNLDDHLHSFITIGIACEDYKTHFGIYIGTEFRSFNCI